MLNSASNDIARREGTQPRAAAMTRVDPLAPASGILLGALLGLTGWALIITALSLT